MKIRNSELLLLAPSSEEASKFFVNIDVNTKKHSHILNEIRKLRRQIYQEEGFLHQSKEDSMYAQRDTDAWHLVAIKQGHGDFLACLRMFFFQDSDKFPSAKSIVAFGGIEFSCPKSYHTHLQVIQNHLELIKDKKKPLVYIGGLSVNRLGRKLGYGAILGLGANALCRAIDKAEGLTFAQSDKGGSLLFQKLGGYLLDRRLEPFYCEQHHCYVQLIGLSSDEMPSKAERIVGRLEKYLKMLPVLTK